MDAQHGERIVRPRLDKAERSWIDFWTMLVSHVSDQLYRAVRVMNASAQPFVQVASTRQ
jgi:hypothetical protein